MKRYIRVILFLSVVSAFSACTLYQQIPIEVLRTEEVTLPLKKNALTFIYRNFKFNKDTLQNYYLEDGVLRADNRTPKREIDSLVVRSCMNSAALGLKKNNICDSPVFYPYDIFPPQTGERIVPLSEELVRKMAAPAKADYLILLETITYFFIYENGMNTNDGFQQVKIAGVWNLYNGKTGRVEDHKTITDTLYWDLNSETAGGPAAVVPPRLIALQQAAGILGENYAKRFFPEWETVDRMLIIPPLEDFRLAAEYAGQQKWDKAAEIWQRYSGEKFGKLAISACYNLALSGEIRDDLQLAKGWADLAVKLAKPYKGSEELEYALKYQEIINDRILRIEKSEKNSLKSL